MYLKDWKNLMLLKDRSMEDVLGKEEHKKYSKFPLIGIELETEAEHSYDPDCLSLNSKYWSYTMDGSLRNNGLEYISAPLKINEIEKAIDNLLEATEDISFLNNRPRCSTHIHMNIRYKTIEEYFSFIIVYCFLENILLSLCTYDRRNNSFCVPLAHNPDRINSLLKIFNSLLGIKKHDDISFLFNFSITNHNKYSSLNYNCMFNLGTIENRIKEGLINDKEELLFWINTLIKIYLFGDKANIHNIMNDIKDCIKYPKTNIYKFTRLFIPAERLKGITHKNEKCLENYKLCLILYNFYCKYIDGVTI